MTPRPIFQPMVLAYFVTDGNSHMLQAVFEKHNSFLALLSAKLISEGGDIRQAIR